MIVVLDTGVLGKVSNPRATAENDACNRWLQAQVLGGATIVIPEIADYELRRELLRADKICGVETLNRLKALMEYEPITTSVMLKAADLWATARKEHRPTASDESLDADMILAAQAILLEESGSQVVVATTNPKHLERFVDARDWGTI